MQKPEIIVGAFVEIDIFQSGADEYTKNLLGRWARSHSQPMKVFSRTAEHVVLQDRNGKIVHFGSTGDPSFSVSHVKLVEAHVGGSR